MGPKGIHLGTISFLGWGFPGGELPHGGKRNHPGVRQFANWLGMTFFYLNDIFADSGIIFYFPVTNAPSISFL